MQDREKEIKRERERERKKERWKLIGMQIVHPHEKWKAFLKGIKCSKMRLRLKENETMQESKSSLQLHKKYQISL